MSLRAERKILPTVIPEGLPQQPFGGMTTFRSLAMTLFFVSFFSPPVFCKSRYVEPVERVDKYSVSKKTAIQIPAKKANLPFILYGEGAKSSAYTPSGWMGDIDALKIGSEYSSDALFNGKIVNLCMKITYLPKGPQGWVGVYWLSPSNNWGTVKGGGYNLSEAKRLTFWLRGDHGGEVINEVKVGGISSGPYPDTDQMSLGQIRLSTQWEQYEIDLTGKDLRHIIGGFCFVLRRADNLRGMKFYLDEIVFDDKAPGDIVKKTDGTVPPATPASQEIPVEVIPSSSSELAVAAPSESLPPVHWVIAFQNPKTALNAQVKKELGDVVSQAAHDPKSHVVVEGHTDAVGAAELNLALSKKRAAVVGNYLISQGLAQEKLTVTGYGEERPLVPEEGHSLVEQRKNRRVEIILFPFK